MHIFDTHFSYFDTMLRARKSYSRLMDPICSRWDLTRNELDVLIFLYNNPGLDRAADIATHRGMAKSHVSLSVSTLEQKGLLCRRTDPEDRRTVRLAPAGDASLIAAQGREAQRIFFSRIFEGLTPEELEAWTRTVEKVSRNIAQLEL